MALRVFKKKKKKKKNINKLLVSIGLYNIIFLHPCQYTHADIYILEIDKKFSAQPISE